MKSGKRYVVISIVLALVLGLLTATMIAADSGVGLSRSDQPAGEVEEPTIPSVEPSALFSMTHSTSQAITALNSVSCNAGGLHADNGYWRVFDLTGEFGVTMPVDVTSVEFGIESASGAGGSQPVEVNLYTVSGAFVLANLTLIASEAISMPDQALTIYNVPISATVPAGTVLAVEIFTPDGQTAGHSLFIGSNAAGESAPSYLWAPACGINEPTPTGDIGFADMNIVMNVYGDTVTPTDVSLTSLGGDATSNIWFSLALGLLAVAATGVFVIRRRAIEA